MISTVFLCDKTWRINNIMQEHESIPLQTGQYLTDLVSEPEKLMEDAENRQALLLEFPKLQRELAVTVRLFPEGNLVFLAEFTNNAEYIEFASLYEKGIEWANTCLRGLFHSDYYQITQLNNQLIDSKRALARSNRRLQQAVEEIEETNQRLQEAEATAEKAMHAAEKANLQKTVYLATMSHDIRTPMNAIVGLADLMAHNVENPEKLLNQIEKLQETSQHLLGLLNDILDLSKIESDSVTLQMQKVNLTKQLSQISGVIRPQAHARRQDLQIKAHRIRHENFWGDGVRLRQVIINLLSNAVKYTPEGGTIRFDIEESTDEKGSLFYRFTVEDTGRGMTPQFLEHIFDPYSRSESALASEIQGTGLGMAITKKIVTMMGGTIEVESEPGKGSRFEVVLPFRPDEEAGENGADRENGKEFLIEEASGEEKVFSIKGIRLLCAEDNDLNAEILGAMLDMAEAKYEICKDGKQLLEKFEKHPKDYDAILTDIQMPVMNGYEAAQAIRRSSVEEGKTIPIIAMTANVFAEDIQRCLKAGMNAHIPKPVDRKALTGIIKKVLEQRTAD